MRDDEERRLIVAYSECAMAYSNEVLKLENARLFLPTLDYVEVRRQVELAHIRCEMARLNLAAYRTAKL